MNLVHQFTICILIKFSLVIGVLKIVVYHRGTFLGGWGQLYVRGKANVAGNMDPDYISVGEIGSGVNALGYP